MQELRNKVAVITGGASGIGRAFADRALEEGMKIVLADIEQGALDQAERALQKAGAEVLAVRTDVSKAQSVEDLAKRTLDTFGAVHLLFNNAGVGGGSVSQGTLADWEWVMGVNLWGVIHGVRVFAPLMLQQNTEAHIVNTASMAGMIAGGLGIYTVTKHAVVALSETLAGELQLQNAKVKVSVLCPGWVNTRIVDSGRNRPPELQNPVGQVAPLAANPAREEVVRQLVANGLKPEQVADLVFAAIREDKFYIFTHPEMKFLIQRRMENILNERNPAIGFA
jgi:NAD(P)-dependent dehydrogenase (short-subunit alcohol dehydrogenase family)